MPKAENRSDWTAVEPEFQDGPTKIKGATSAYMFFAQAYSKQVCLWCRQCVVVGQ